MNTACIKYLGSLRVNLANFLSFTFLELSVCVYTQEKNAKYIKCALDSPCEKLSGSCRTKKNTNYTDLYLPIHTCMHTTVSAETLGMNTRRFSEIC